jgi:hypothetical protein
MKIEHLIWLVFIVGFIIYAIFMYIADRRKREKREKSAVRLKEFGPQIPFHSLPNEDLISKFKDSTGVMRFGGLSGCFFDTGCFFDKRGAMNLTDGNIGSIDFVTFEYEYSVGGGLTGTGWDRRDFRGTAILLQSDQLALPSFELGRKFIDTPKKFQPLTPLKAKEKAGSKQCPTCGSWDVRGGPTDEYGGTGDWCDHCKKSLYKMNEEKALKLLSKAYADLRGWSALASNTQLLLYRQEVMVAADEKYQEFMEEALKVFQMFQLGLSDLSYQRIVEDPETEKTIPEIEGKTKLAIMQGDYSGAYLIGIVIFVSLVIVAGALFIKDDSKAYYNRGNAYYKKGQYDQAISDYNKAIEINASNDWYYNSRGNAYADKGQYDQAISDYTKAIELNPEYANSYHNRGNAYIKLDRSDRACDDYQKACDLGDCDGLRWAENNGYCR